MPVIRDEHPLGAKVSASVDLCQFWDRCIRVWYKWIYEADSSI